MKDKEKIFYELIEDHHQSFNRIIWSYANSKSDFEDIRQNILLRVWKGLETFRHEASIGSWLYRIAINTCIDYVRDEFRSNSTFVKSERPMDIKGDSDIESELIKSEGRVLLHNCIKKLSPIDQTLTTLYFEDLKHKEIASIIGISEKNVAVKLSRIRTKLNEMMEDYENA
jgi:RNA polymerase sigma-70 factor (ECF subfamily)